MGQDKINAIGVFCGSSSGNAPIYSQAAEQLADVMSGAGISLVYGGAIVGLMGVIANRMLEKGATVIGVIPQSLTDVEIVHIGLSELHVVQTMQERKKLIDELADGFIMLPGGAGSLDEFFEMLTLGQLGYHQKPCGILNTDGYYDDLLRFLDHVVAQGFMKQIYRDIIIVEKSPEILINRIMNYTHPEKKWGKSLQPIQC